MSGKWDQIGFIKSSRYRKMVIRRLAKEPAMPSEIANEEDVEIASISNALRPLRERSLVELLVPDERRKGRVYGLTAEAEELLDELDLEVAV